MAYFRIEIAKRLWGYRLWLYLEDEPAPSRGVIGPDRIIVDDAWGMEGVVEVNRPATGLSTRGHKMQYRDRVGAWEELLRKIELDLTKHPPAGWPGAQK